MSSKSFLKTSMLLLSSVAMANAQTFTAADVATHNTQADCWEIINGNVYSMTNYISKHPGGATVIVNQCGNDASQAYQNGSGNHQPSLLSTSCVLEGTLATVAPSTATPTTAKATTAAATTQAATTQAATTKAATTAATATTAAATTKATATTLTPTTAKPTQFPTAATVGQITVTFTDAAAYSVTCTNGAWTFPAAYTAMLTVTNAGVTNTAAPSTANGGDKTTVKASYFVNGQGAPTTVSGTAGVANSVTAANVWMFTLEAGAQPSATVSLAVQPPCSSTSTVPKVTTAFAIVNQILAPGGNGVPLVSPAVTAKVVNNINVANNAATTVAPTTKAPSVAPTTKAATTAAPTAAAVTLNCQLQIPVNPFTAKGLSTPWQLLNPTTTGCLQVLGTATFANCNILNMDTGAISVYNPLVIAAGTTPLIAPTVPTLPTNYVVGCWFGTNAMTTTLVGTIDTNAGAGVDSLVEANCINGGGNTFSIFTQYASCNGMDFFNAANQMIALGKLVVPPLGVDLNGNACPTVLDFGLVDQDQSDNTAATYLADANGNVAQNTPQNAAALKAKGTAVTVIDNGSDERLITVLNNAIGCKGWMIPDLADPTGNTLVTSYATNELQGRLTTPPLAFIPAGDPMVLNNGVPDVNKLNAYRAYANQARVTSVAQASTLTYCQNMFSIGAPKILGWMAQTLNAAAPDFAVALSPTLGGVLSLRFNAAVGAGNLNCAALMAAAATAKAQSSDFKLQDVFTPGPTTSSAGNVDPNFTSQYAAMISPLDIMSTDANGNLILATTQNSDGSIDPSLTWEQAMGINEQTQALTTDNTNAINTDNGMATTGTSTAGTGSTTTSSSSNLGLSIGVGIAIGVVVGGIIGGCISFKMATDKNKRTARFNKEMAY